MAVRFDAPTDKISYTGGGVPDPSSGFTFTAWVYNSVDLGTNATYARLWSAGGTTATFATGVDGESGPSYFTGGGSISATTGTPVGVWRKIAFTCTGTSGKVYAATPGGSTEVVTGTVAGVASPTSVTIGGRSTTDDSEWWNGRVAYVRLWSAVLSQAEIETEWASTVHVRTTNLWAAWPVVTHTDLTDHSGNGRHLSAGSTATTTEGDPPADVTGTAAGAGGGSGSATGVREVVGVAAGSGGGVGTATVVADTPAERTVTVAAETRVFSVPAESRTVVVPAESRVFEVV